MDSNELAHEAVSSLARPDRPPARLRCNRGCIHLYPGLFCPSPSKAFHLPPVRNRDAARVLLRGKTEGGDDPRRNAGTHPRGPRDHSGHHPGRGDRIYHLLPDTDRHSRGGHRAVCCGVPLFGSCQDR